MTHDFICFSRREFIHSHFAKIFPNIFLLGLGDFDPDEVMREGWVMMSTTEHRRLPFFDPGEGSGLNPFPIVSNPRCIPLVACWSRRKKRETFSYETGNQNSIVSWTRQTEKRTEGMQSIERDEYKKQAKSSDDDDDDDVRAVMKRGIWKKGSTDWETRSTEFRQNDREQ